MPNIKELSKEIYNSQDVVDFDELFEGDNTNVKVSNLDEAARYAYGLAETRKSIKELQEVAEKEIENWRSKITEVEEWLRDVLTPLKAKEEHLATHLQLYHINQYNIAKTEKEQKKLTSIKLPYGVTLKSRAQADKFEVADVPTYRTYAKENNLLKPAVEPDVNWAELKKNLAVTDDGRVLDKSTGEFLDFIKVIPQERKFEVK
ncbi:host-nuclease inhibitor Gam family protein [Bacillus amyloliquefaciens]|uniref:host-nuclease inhibitor Gam family protein n=1 Tax=Bacillus amyloliquefaciens TaxID=1390 RepID=UPI0022B03172|nr:host-nuclease inhibitor Gam family protein [Bacillus amyloliquefaciens]MCZ4246937.1 host-nuclease inhibitor Gam family protein [Bacillus amyloliquefaciens]